MENMGQPVQTKQTPSVVGEGEVEEETKNTLKEKNNKKKMNKYNSTTALGGLLDCDHSTVLHYIHRRKPTMFYNDNTRCINDFLNS
jgi:hypothetical protein